MIYSIPRPETDRSAEYSGCRSVYLVTVSFKIYGQNAFNIIKSISCAKSVSNYHTLRLPSVCILEKDRNRELINISYISNVNICIVYRIVLRFSTRIIVTAKNNRRITRNSEVSDCNCGITECILYLKLNGMSTGKKCNCLTCKILTGNSYVRKLIAVNVNFSGCIVKLNIISNCCRESNVITINSSTVCQCNRLVLSCISRVGNSRKNSIIYSRAIVKGNIINIEGMYRRNHRLNISTNKGRRTRIRFICNYRSTNIIVCCKINRSIYPS